MQAVRDGSRWMIKLDDGQDLFKAIQEHARSHSIGAAIVVSGIGMLKTAAVGYWNGREYDVTELTEPHELVGLHGSIASLDEGPSVHLHAELANARHEVVGGHLMRGTVGILTELFVETFPGATWGRPMNESLGLRALDLEP